MLNDFSRDLRELQISQYRHDEVAHRDIAWLPVPKRLTHFTLHFAKYAGALVTAHRAHNKPDVERILADTFAILLATANTLNLDLQAKLATDDHSENTDNPSTEGLLLRFCEAVGPMAKACEAVDHMENFPSRSTLDAGVVSILQVVAALADSADVDLVSAAEARWKVAERKSFLFSENKFG